MRPTSVRQTASTVIHGPDRSGDVQHSTAPINRPSGRSRPTTAHVLSPGGEPGVVFQTPRVPARNVQVQEPTLSACQTAGPKGPPLTMQPHPKHSLRLIPRTTEPRPTPLSLPESPKLFEPGRPSLRVQLDPLVAAPRRGPWVSRNTARASTFASHPAIGWRGLPTGRLARCSANMSGYLSRSTRRCQPTAWGAHRTALRFALV